MYGCWAYDLRWQVLGVRELNHDICVLAFEVFEHVSNRQRNVRVNFYFETDFDILWQKVQANVHFVAVFDKTVVDIIATRNNCVAVVIHRFEGWENEEEDD